VSRINALLEHLFLIFENSCVERNTDSTIAADMQSGDSSFWQYKVYADIRGGSLERRHQTTVSSRVSRRVTVACVLHSLSMFAVCVINRPVHWM